MSRTSVSVQQVSTHLAKGNIAVLSPLASANVFVRGVRWAGTFARGDRRTMCNAFIRKPLHDPLKVPLSAGCGPHLIHGSLDLH